MKSCIRHLRKGDHLQYNTAWVEIRSTPRLESRGRFWATYRGFLEENEVLGLFYEDAVLRIRRKRGR